MYVPPFTITEKMLHLVSEVSEQMGILNARLGENVPSPMLRKKSQIKTIHSSLAIENNTLSLKQVTDIVDGKHVLGAPDEIQEVKNAIEAYRLMPELDAFKEKDLLKAHGLMMKCLLDAMENYEESAEEEPEELHDKLHDKLHDMFPELSEKAFGVLEVLKAHPALKAEDIGMQVSLSERQVKTYLNALKQSGLIVRVGSNKTGYWKVNI